MAVTGRRRRRGPLGVAHAAYGVVRGRLLVAGGVYTAGLRDGLEGESNLLQTFDPATGAWTAEPIDLPADDAFGPFPNRASGTAEAPKQHAWSAEQDHALLVAAQTRGVSAATWESLAGAGGACRGATAEQVEARFAWLCDAAKKQKCASAARGGKPKGKPRKPKPRG